MDPMLVHPDHVPGDPDRLKVIDVAAWPDPIADNQTLWWTSGQSMSFLLIWAERAEGASIATFPPWATSSWNAERGVWERVYRNPHVALQVARRLKPVLTEGWTMYRQFPHYFAYLRRVLVEVTGVKRRLGRRVRVRA